MPDPNEPAAPIEASPAALAEQPASVAPTFTAAQVADRERVAAQRAHDAAMAESRRIFEGKQRPSTPATTQQPATPTAPSADDFGRVRAYERSLGRYDFTDDALAMLDERFASEKPADVAAFVTRMATAFRVPPRGGTTTPTTITPATQAPAPVANAANASPVTGTAAPSNPTTVITDDTPLINLSETQRQDWIKQHGWLKYTDRMRDESMRGGTRLRVPR